MSILVYLGNTSTGALHWLHCILYFQGVLSSSGEQILFADADGATTFEDLRKLMARMSEIKQQVLY